MDRALLDGNESESERLVAVPPPADADRILEESAHSQQRQKDPSCFSKGASTWKLLPFILINSLQTMLIYSMVPELAASWFQHCDPPLEGNSTVPVTDTCKPNYETAQAIAGIVDSTRNLLAFFVAALIGRLSDVHGRKPMMMLGTLTSALPTFALFLTNAESPAAYYLACILAGLFGAGSSGGAFNSVVNAFVADVYSTDERAAQFGLLIAISSLGLTFNPVLGLLTRNLGARDVCLVSLTLMLIGFLYIVFLIPESLPLSRRNKFSWERTMNPLAPLKLLSQSSIMRWVALVMLLATSAEAGVREIALFYCDKVLGLEKEDARQFNLQLFAMIGIMMFLTSTLFLRVFLAFNMRGSTLLVIGQCNNAIHITVYILLHFFPHKWLIFSNALPTAFTIISVVAASTIISTSMGPQEQGFALGTLAACSGVADVFGPLLYSQLFSYFSAKYAMPQAPFLLGLFFALLAAVITIASPIRSLEKKPRRRLLTSHSRLYEENPDLEDDTVPDDDETSDSFLQPL